jgi:hypothetical protein
MRKLIALVLLCLVATASWAELPLYVAVEAMHRDVADRAASDQLGSVLADADKYLKTQERFADGRWKLAILLGGLRRGFESRARTGDDWARHEAAIRTLAHDHPDSQNAWLMLAILHQGHAWAVRGAGFSNTVSRDRQRTFTKYLAAARQVLDAHPAPANPAWHQLQIDIGGALGDGPAALDAMFAKAVRAQPDYQQTWFSRLNYLTPKWGGSMDDLVRFINDSARVPTTEGHGMMARLLWIADTAGYPETIADPRIDWKAVKQAYDDVLAHYPDDWNAQWFFLQACDHADKAEAVHLLSYVRHDPSPALLQDNVQVFNVCRDWARGKLPMFMMRDTATGQLRRIE